MFRVCTFCKNHDQFKPKRDHKSICPYGIESHWQGCEKCSRTRKRQISVAHEKKLDYKRKNNAITSLNDLNDRERAARMCIKCKRHGQPVVSDKKHNKECPRMNCTCEACRSTDNRRKYVRIDLREARMQMRRQQQHGSRSLDDLTDLRSFSSELPAVTSNSFSETDLKLETFDVDKQLIGFDGNEQPDAQQMMIAQHDNELTFSLDFESVLDDLSLEVLSELLNQPQSMQQILYDGCIDDGQTN